MSEPHMGCGHPACCQAAFSHKARVEPENAAQIWRTLFVATLVFIMPACIFVAGIALLVDVFSPLLAFIVSLMGCSGWYFLLWLGLRCLSFNR